MSRPERPRKHVVMAYSYISAGFVVLTLLVISYYFSRAPVHQTVPQVLLSEDFSGYKLGDSVDVSKVWEDNSFKFYYKLKSKWYFTGTGTYHEPYIPLDYTDDPSLYLESVMTAGDSEWDNYAFKVRIEPTDQYGAGLVFRYVDVNNYYRFLMIKDPKAGGPYIALEKKVNGKITTIKKIDSGSDFHGNYEVGKWYRFKIVVNGSQIQAYSEGNVIMQIKDDSFKKGKIGLFAWEHSSAFYDDVLVNKIQ